MTNVSTLTEGFEFFDAIYCINLDQDQARWLKMQAQAERLGFLSRLRHFSAIETPGNHHIGCALSHRRVLQSAYEHRYEKILVLEDDAIFRVDTLTQLQKNVLELQNKQWDLWYLGGHRWGHHYRLSDGCQSLLEVGLEGCEPVGPTCTHAIAYHRHCYAAIFNLLPDTPKEMGNFLAKTAPGIDQIYAFGKGLKRLISEPHLASQPLLLAREDDAFEVLVPD